MRFALRSLGLHTALAAGLTLLALPGCSSEADLDDDATVEPADGAVGSDDSGALGQEDPGDGEESLDDDGYLGDSTGSDVGAGAGHEGDVSGEHGTDG
jgi:hypothetical protein